MYAQNLIAYLVCLPLVSSLVLGEDSIKIEPPWKDAANGWVEKGEYIDLNLGDKERLFFQYCAAADSGVQLERVKGGEVLWRKHVQSLGVMHSKYSHHVEVRVWKETIYIESRGSSGIIYETRNLSDGSLIKREIRETSHPIGAFLMEEQNERIKKAEPTGSGQPATASESKPEGKDKPQSKSKPAPR